MKRITSFCILALALMTVACAEIGDPEGLDRPIVDWYPVNVILLVQDKDGNDLLNPSLSGNYFEGASITFKGENHEARRLEPGEYWSAIPTKAYLARIKGFRLVYETLTISGKQENRWFLVFGEIDGALDMDEDLVVTWPSGETDTIHYHCSDHRVVKENGEWIIDCKRSWKLNGKDATNPFSLVK